LDTDGISIIQDKKYTVVSQLSLVDLAGSERAGKAKTTGQRLHEAGENFFHHFILYIIFILRFYRRNK